MVSYCGRACRSRDSDTHKRACKSFQAVQAFDDVQKEGRLWRGCCDDSGQIHEWRVKIDGVLRFHFPLQVVDRSALAQSMTTWQDWANLITSSPFDWSRDPVSKALSPESFRRIVLGADLETRDERVLHQLATDVASFPLTLFQALRAFGLLSDGCSSTAPLVIHVIGAEANKEGAFAREINTILQSLLGFTPLLIVYIGPLNACSPSLQQDAEIFRCLRTRPQLGSARSFFFRGTYADFLGSALYSSPDLVMAFHPGFHDGTYPWWPTLQFLLHEDVPLAITCFSDTDLRDTREMIAADNPLFRSKIIFGESDSGNAFASRFVKPEIEGKNELRANNMHLLGLRGILKRFPKGGGVLDGSHMEVMAMSVANSLHSAAESPPSQADVVLLQERGKSYVQFAAALEKVRPCVGQQLISVEHPAMWQSVADALSL